MYMSIICLYQTGHVYVYKFPVPNRPVWYMQFINIYITCFVQAIYTHIHHLFGTGSLYTYTWPVWYRQFINIYMTCLVQANDTHIHDLLGTGNLCTYTWPAWYRQFMHIYMTCLVEPINTHIHDLFGTGNLYCTKQVRNMCINCLYQAGHVYVYTLPVPNRPYICV
jgi:hypothetical protein